MSLQRLWPCVLLAAGFAAACESTPEEASEGMMVALPGRCEYLESRLEGLAGERAWPGGDYVADGQIESATPLGSDLILVAAVPSEGGYVAQCVDLGTGVPRWILNLGPVPLAVPPRGGDDTVVFIFQRDKSMVVVDRATGSRLHNMQVRIDAVPAAAPVSTASTVYVPELVTDRLVSVDAATGNRGWHMRVAGTPLVSPVISSRIPRQVVYFATDAGWLYGVPAAGAREVRPDAPVWERRLSAGVSSGISMAEGVVDGSHQVTLYVPCEDNGLYAIDGSTGAGRWTWWSDAPFRGSEAPAVAVGRVHARNATRFNIIDQATGRRLFARGAPTPDSPEQFFAPEAHETCDRFLAANARRTWLLRGPNTVVVMETATGTIVGERVLTDFDWFVTNTATGCVVLGTRDGFFIAFE